MAARFPSARRARLAALAIAAAGTLAAPAATRLTAQGAATVDTTGMALVPAGDFWMGRTRLWLIDEIGWQIRDRADDRPVHRVELAAYFIDTKEVTNADYARFVAAGKAAAPYHWRGDSPPASKASLPIYNVSWQEAADYCGWLGKRLPTEAEWEKAARGGVADVDYPWGNDYFTDDAAGAGAEAAASTPPTKAKPPVKHAHSNATTGPVPVGSFEANGYGLYDVSGNVWEWVADWYDLNYYSSSPVTNPSGPASGLYKVIRGGSWADPETRQGTVYFRNYTAPDLRAPTLGMRCAVTAPK
ncbi:MAG: SUMF1/EgtB/PvdO family nonheme iron enzyme [Vicinamibacterales bacterium]